MFTPLTPKNEHRMRGHKKMFVSLKSDRIFFFMIIYRNVGNRVLGVNV